MPSYNTPKRGVAYKLGISLVSQANTKLLQVNPTFAAGDAQISKDFGPFVNLTTLPSVSPAGSDSVMVDLSASEMTADNIVLRLKDVSGAEWCDQAINIQPTVNQLDDLAAAVTAAAIRAALGMAAANMDSQLSTIGNATLAVKAKTDNLNFTVAGQVDSNIQYVNDVQVKGTGATGNEWGPT